MPFRISEYQTQPPERYYYTDEFADEPVNPDDLIRLVTEKLSEFGNIVPSHTPQMIKELCRGFNECIRLNEPIVSYPAPSPFVRQTTQAIPTITYHERQTLIFSPKTGSAKSLTAKLYVSILRDKTSLIVVPRVDDAIEYCKDINEWSDNPSYARCYYSISFDNIDSPYRCDVNEINQYKCLVLTHAMYKIINKYETRLSNQLSSHRRDLIVIDERINLYEQYDLKEKQIVDLANMVDLLIQNSFIGLDDTKELLVQLHSEMRIYIKKAKDEGKNTFFIKSRNRRSNQATGTYNFDVLSTIINNESMNLTQYATSLISSQNYSNNNSIRKTIQELITNINEISHGNIIFVKSGNSNGFIKTFNITNLYGSAIVLDATASINQIYEDTTWFQSNNVKHYMTIDNRTYSNMKLYKAVGYEQGKTSIYDNLTASAKIEKASEYLTIASNLLTDGGKLLIVAHKDFKVILENNYSTAMGNIKFTHWGNHVGRNEWSDCNKVMIIGWYYLPTAQYRINYVNAVNNFYLLNEENISRVHFEYLTTQLADDLIQAIMRSSARKTSSENGDCPDTEVYIFVPLGRVGNKVFELLQSQFNDMNVITWAPEFTVSSFAPTGSIQKINNIFDYLKRLERDGHQDISTTTLIQRIGMERSYFYKLLKKEYFQEMFLESGYTQHRGRFIIN